MTTQLVIGDSMSNVGGMSTLEICSDESRLDEKAPICKLCLKERAAYTCPRCNLAYCSLACYRSEKHADCSESFYKDNFIQALHEMRGSSDDKKQILEMLSRVESEQPYKDSDDEDEEEPGLESLERRLAGLDLDRDSDKVWERLTMRERQEFEDILKGGGLGAVLEEWQPWWLEHDSELITELQIPSDQPTERSKVTASQPPRVLDSIPQLSDLLKTPASPLIVYNLINVLYCYVYVTRLFNGCHMELPVQGVQSFLEACSVLCGKASFANVEDSIQSAVHTITQLPSLPNDRAHLVTLVRDVVHVVLGRSRDSPTIYVKSALSDLHELFSKARKIARKAAVPEGRTSKRTGSDSNKFKSVVFQGKKKMMFFLAWVNGNPETLKEKAVEIQLLYKSMEVELDVHNKMMAAVEDTISKARLKKGQALIEEIS